jgi:hypothetical protein
MGGILTSPGGGAAVRAVLLRLLAALLGSALALVAAELLAAAHLARRGSERDLLLRSLRAEPAATSLQEVGGPEVLHPYVGVVAAPGSPARGNSLGFPGPDPRTPPSPGVARVALLGGSVAKGQVEADGAWLASRLGELPRLDGRRVELVTLALGGHKQPQGLHALAHALSLGAELDLVIALDGFNEVALAAAENLAAGVSAAYPRGWAARAGAAPGVLDAVALAAIESSRARRRAWRTWLRPPAACGSSLALVLFQALERGAQRAEARHQARLLRDRGAAPRGLRGPGPVPTTVDGAVAEAVALWERSSLLVHQLCAARGIDYLHALQPNQYDPEVAPWSGDTWREDSPMRPGAQAGYPLLRAAGARLAASGVAFVDLSAVFGADASAAYGDDCCHYGPAGIRAVNQALVDALRARTHSASGSSSRRR